MEYKSNNDLIEFEYFDSSNLIYTTVIESNSCRNLEQRLSGFYILGVTDLLCTRNFKVTVRYDYTEHYKDEHRKIDYDFYTITITDNSTPEDESPSVTITCKTELHEKRVHLIHDNDSFEVTVYNKDTIKSLPHYYNLKKSAEDKDFERMCETIGKLIETCNNNKEDINKYFKTYQHSYASAYDDSLPEFIINDRDEIIMQPLEPLNKEIRNKLLDDEFFS